MLGNGCMWKAECTYYKQKANGYHKKNYCNDDFGCEQCPYRIKHNGNTEVKKNYDRRASQHGTIKFGQIVWIILILSAVLKVMGII